MNRELFAQQVGVSVDVVTGWINKGYIPCMEVGKYRLVNLALLNKMALEQDFRQ
jgi:predicted site-specific integrase-resolvase